MYGDVLRAASRCDGVSDGSEENVSAGFRLLLLDLDVLAEPGEAFEDACRCCVSVSRKS
jgi:hypothetical protein